MAPLIKKKKGLALGLDVSTQGISAVVLDIDARTVVYEHSLDYGKDTRLNTFGLNPDDYILPPENEGEASQPPLLYFAALDAIFSDLKKAVKIDDIVAVNNSGQQHGHVYLNFKACFAFRSLTHAVTAQSDLVPLLKGGLAWDRAPIWMTSDTLAEADFVRQKLGGKAKAIALSGSNVPLRFTGVIMRKVALRRPEVYEGTENIQLISSLVPAILSGNSRVPLDYGNACGMSLMDYLGKKWSDILIRAVADGLPSGEHLLKSKLPDIVAPDAVIGTVAAYFVKKYGFSPACKVIAGSGDNPQAKILVAGDLLSLGSSIVNMVATDGHTLDMDGYANAMYDGVGRPFMFGCRTNGALVWDRLRSQYGLEKEAYAPAEEALSNTPVAQNFVFWQPRIESFPASPNIDLTRIGNETPTLGTDYSGLIETTLAAVYHHSRGFMKETREPLYVTGGARNSREILRRVAAIWDRPVIPVEEGGAALGAAVAGACAYLQSIDNRMDIGQYLGTGILKQEEPVNPAGDDVTNFHRPGGFLERFAVEEANLLK